jgi:hypothetical protein
VNSQGKRRWLRFSTRTLLVAVTILCVWLGWQVHIVRERKRLREWAIEHGGYVNVEYVATPFTAVVRPRRISVPWYRKLLGDQAIATISFSRSWENEEQAKEIDVYFPEADITCAAASTTRSSGATAAWHKPSQLSDCVPAACFGSPFHA